VAGCFNAALDGWIAYYVAGVEQRESAGDTEVQARAVLTDRLAALGRGGPVTSDGSRLPVKQAVDSWVANLEERSCKAIGPSRSKAKRLIAIVGHVKIARLTPQMVRRYAQTRRDKDDVRDSTIHGDLLSLTAALNLARKEGRIAAVPYIPRPPAGKPRRGYPEPEEPAAILPHVRGEAYRDALDYADATGRRSGEVVELE
jgi:integrase